MCDDLEIELRKAPGIGAGCIDDADCRSRQAEAPSQTVGDTVAHCDTPYDAGILSPGRDDKGGNRCSIHLEQTMKAVGGTGQPRRRRNVEPQCMDQGCDDTIVDGPGARGGPEIADELLLPRLKPALVWHRIDSGCIEVLPHRVLGQERS